MFLPSYKQILLYVPSVRSKGDKACDSKKVMECIFHHLLSFTSMHTCSIVKTPSHLSCAIQQLWLSSCLVSNTEYLEFMSLTEWKEFPGNLIEILFKIVSIYKAPQSPGISLLILVKQVNVQFWYYYDSSWLIGKTGMRNEKVSQLTGGMNTINKVLFCCSV